ncbi:Fimbrillin-A associated anchor protein Mfa1 and Mfa2 [Chitinophaga sp. YR627]|uniref:FimB/Mfa2 family fimbrial subunit n=1 Tax=Chitinophaga sp. YR627 TaxID=1881041 RepID=UPI0008F1F0D6|nr:FimB/Mfa2 family fimbrial subunit [Chitinophaga sp. YR627]SFO53276.1 Fimbrillin-A associated anchor protein Mfa1 and Mfa2 [Chitinophaga sp. YR627]
MKKFSFAPLLALVLLSCSKDALVKENTTLSQEKKQSVQLNLTGFIQEHSNMRVAGNAAGRAADLVKISDIYYAVYDNSGNKVHDLHQDTINQQGNFGTISDSLAPGHYTIVLLAGDQPLITHAVGSSGNISEHIVSHQIMGAGALPIGQIFYKKLSLDVTADNTPQPLEVSLDRIVGKLVVEVLDALPANGPHGSLGFSVTPVMPFFSLASGQVREPDPIWQYNGTRTSQTTFEDYFFGSGYEFSITIYYVDKNTGEDKQKTIEHITVAANKKTIVKGYLYGAPESPAGQGYQIKVNQDWAADSTLINF